MKGTVLAGETRRRAALRPRRRRRLARRPGPGPAAPRKPELRTARLEIVIYLDHAATTPLHPLALEAMLPFFDGTFGNPSGLYAAGREAQSALDSARRAVADCLGARPAEILFTSGGTESINSAMVGIAGAMRRAGAGNH